MSGSRVLTLGALLTLPSIGLALLIAEPRLDVHWQHQPAHFWMVLAAAALSVALAYATGTAARRRNDLRVFLVSLSFLAAAGFLGLHALATPGVLLEGQNAGFTLATPIGLLLASIFAASSAEFPAERAGSVMRRAGLLRATVIAAMVAWAAFSLLELPPLRDAQPPERASMALVVLSVIGCALYAVAVVRYANLVRTSSAPALSLAMAAAFLLLAQAQLGVALGRSWHASWWEWHLLMLAAFAVVTVAVHREWHEERFASLYLPGTRGGTREISVLFADLQGFTSFTERHAPAEVTAMLNEYFGVAIPPVVERFGGDVDRLVGDALMVTFNTRGDQPNHAERAARAGLALQRATAQVAAAHPDWPRFRVGVNTGEATVGVLGTAGGRTFTVIGDAVNLAARLEGQAAVGDVVVGAETARRLPGAHLESLGTTAVKGKADPVEIFRLIDV